ncbi:efflux transporter outer membrane subunit [Paraburkholderia susongensis]|uniref:Efflux transporter, outer membrane factor (OMF) lipoprotein, NodT family n=1 Tax=Paraburkholderia susongensis TaxID=1515439 RepID=A0A1X7LLD7_9BURK|nr:efflux transporter outer membrane subunit [Paraburkholderia susongensis]SMG53969.1 efflux transporter, outer membrane factor (OMF) lipoprotein, NodT family [Paraburkholderia susongensis]
MIRARPYVLAIAALLLEAGCTGSLQLDKPAAFPEQYSEAQQTVSTPMSAQDLATWWTQYNDPTLNRLVELALAHNFDIATAYARVDQAQAGIRAARSQLLPSVGASLSGAKYHGGETSLEFQELLGVNDLDAQFWRAGLQAQWEIDLFGRGRARLSAAHEQARAAAGDAEAVRLSVVSGVADLYVTYRGLLRQRTILLQSQAIADDFVNIAEKSFTAGLVLSTDIEAARAGRAQVDARLQEVENGIVQARLNLQNLCGVQPAQFAGILDESDTLMTALPNIEPGQPVDLLMRRPDLIAAQARVNAAVKQSDAARLNYWPTLSLSGLLARNGWEIAGQALGPSTFWLFGAALSMPLIDFGARRSQVESSDAQAQQAMSNYEKTALGAFYDVDRALARLNRQDELFKARNEEVTRRTTQLSQVQRRYEVGDTGRVDIDQVRVALLESQSSQVREEVGKLQAQFALFRAMGGGWLANPPPVASTQQPAAGTTPATASAPASAPVSQ